MPSLTTDADRVAMRDSAGARLALLAESFARLAGRVLAEGAAEGLDLALWEAPRAIVAHGAEARPRFFYGNRAALELFEMRAAEFIGLLSDRSAEPAARDARAKMLATLARERIVEGYTGVRVAAGGRRFRIVDATVWDLLDACGKRHGQAATFARWSHLD